MTSRILTSNLRRAFGRTPHGARGQTPQRTSLRGTIGFWGRRPLNAILSVTIACSWQVARSSLLPAEEVVESRSASRSDSQSANGSAQSSSASSARVEENFDRDSNWESFRSRLLPAELPVVRQDFGYCDGNRAGGKGRGEAGGLIHRAHSRASYARAIQPRTLDDRLTASGTLAVTNAGGGSGVLIGWFNQEKSQGWRTPHSLAFRIDGNGGKYWLFYEYGTKDGRTHGGGAFEGERYQTTPTPPYKADGTVHRWKLTYDPQGAGGRGLLTFQCDDQRWELPFLEGHRQEGATFDRFGIWNQQTAGSSLELYVDDMEVDGKAESFDRDPDWEADGSRVEYEQRVIRPYHDFGFSLTNFAGKAHGEIGGFMFRDEQPAYYADKIGPATMDHELYASGNVVLRSAGADSGVQLGWFGADAKKNKSTPEHEQRQTDYLGIMIEGPSRIGHFFRPSYSTSQGAGDAPTHEGTPRQLPIIRPDGTVHAWSLRYNPRDADGRGRITLTFDGQSHTLDLPEGHRRQNAHFDRFGVFDIQSGGHHIELYLDDLVYSHRISRP